MLLIFQVYYSFFFAAIWKQEAFENYIEKRVSPYKTWARDKLHREAMQKRLHNAMAMYARKNKSKERQKRQSSSSSFRLTTLRFLATPLRAIALTRRPVFRCVVNRLVNAIYAHTTANCEQIRAPVFTMITTSELELCETHRDVFKRIVRRGSWI